MKQHIETLIRSALQQLVLNGELDQIPIQIQIETTKDKQHGDFASNIALLLGKHLGQKPREFAQRIVECMPRSAQIAKLEIAGPGFINFYIEILALTQIVPRVLTEQGTFGCSQVGRNRRILLEFVSSNPTGPLHVGHGRSSVIGSVVANLLAAVGFNVYCEYYVNDAGRQVDILTISVWLRYLGLCGHEIILPPNAYQGEYVNNIAQAIFIEHGTHFAADINTIWGELPSPSPNDDQELYIDALITWTKNLLANKYQMMMRLSLDHVMADICADLADFGVHYDNWFAESELVKGKIVDDVLVRLSDAGHTYRQDGALWFRSSTFGDSKDRVLVRANGTCTYFANDVAYHWNKFDRGFDLIINIFGADHHGYIARIRAAIIALDFDPQRFIQILYQFVTLYRSGVPVKMSTRKGEFITLRELREEVGNDAARFFYVMRKNDQHIDFDLDLAKEHSLKNPVYYVQYAYARICSVFKQLAARKLELNLVNGYQYLAKLTTEYEKSLLLLITNYPSVINNAALQYEAYLLTNYLRELAAQFHTYYNATVFLVDDIDLRDARLALILAIQQVLSNGFAILGIRAMENM